MSAENTLQMVVNANRGLSARLAAERAKSYDEFVAAKIRHVTPSGIEPATELHSSLFPWQADLVRLALRVGRFALFEECGLGKTFQQLEWARQVVDHTNGKVLILCPLAVASQTAAEASRFGIRAHVIRDASDVTDGISICNYDKLHLLNPAQFDGVVLDESSILKAFEGKMRRSITDAFRATKFKLCCSATPAPNDFTELGQHAEFLNICTPAQMLATYFINDTFDTGTWRLKGHSVESFWRWVGSWAACVRKPSDIGGDDSGYALPPVITRFVEVPTDLHTCVETGELFTNPVMSATTMHAHNRKTMAARVEAAAQIVNASKEPFVVWCETNDESEALHAAIPDSVEVAGHHSSEAKEDRLGAFSSGTARVIVTKPSIAGWGLNWQHCANDIFVGLSHSFEKYYQAGKRIHRFGQSRQVTRHVVMTDAERAVFANLMRKNEKHETMHELVKFTRNNLRRNASPPKMTTTIHTETSENWTAHNGDCVRVARTIPDNSIGLSVFSPPFADLFTYSDDVQDMGNCGGMPEFMEQFGFLVDEISRITMPGRECAVHCCDLLATKWKDGAIELKDFSTHIANAFRERGWRFHSRITIWKSPVTEMQRTKAHGLLYKTLLSDSADSRVGVPDYLLVFRKPGDNPKPIKRSKEEFNLDRWQEIASPVWMSVDQGRVLNGEGGREQNDERHICPLQLDVIERAVFLWSGKGDTVFSPFMGIGSEGFCSVKMGRKFIGAELKTSYFKEAVANLRKADNLKADLFTA